MEIVRLGQGVDQTGRLAPEALARTTGVLRDYAAVIAATRPRDPHGRHQRHPGREQHSGVHPPGQGDTRGRARGPDRIRGGQAVVHRGDRGTGRRGDGGPFLVADIGGGSTEFVLGRAGSRRTPPRHAISVNIGCVRMTERHLHGDPPTPEQVAAAAADIDAALDTVSAAVPVREARTLIGLAGSVTTVAGIAMGLPAYDAARIHHARVSAADVHEVTRSLLAQTRAARAAIGVMHPGRVDVIGGGALILDRIMERFGFSEVLVSEHDILDGIAWSLARTTREQQWPPTDPATPGGWPDDPAGPDTPVAHSAREVTELADGAASLHELTARQSVCRACPRLVAWREQVAVTRRRAFRGERYWGRPVPGWGAERPRLLIVGLAPAAHGGNRTGRIFTGDRSGDFLFASLYRCGLAIQPTSVAAGRWPAPGGRQDGGSRPLCPAGQQTGTRRAGRVRAVAGRRTPARSRGPARHRVPRRVRLAGGMAGAGHCGFLLPRPRPAFGHGAEVRLTSARGPDGVLLIGCYHPSQQNTFTGRVTPAMLDAIFIRARAAAGPGSPGPIT